MSGRRMPPLPLPTLRLLVKGATHYCVRVLCTEYAYVVTTPAPGGCVEPPAATVASVAARSRYCVMYSVCTSVHYWSVHHRGTRLGR